MGKIHLKVHLNVAIIGDAAAASVLDAARLWQTRYNNPGIKSAGEILVTNYIEDLLSAPKGVAIVYIDDRTVARELLHDSVDVVEIDVYDLRAQVLTALRDATDDIVGFNKPFVDDRHPVAAFAA